MVKTFRNNARFCQGKKVSLGTMTLAVDTEHMKSGETYKLSIKASAVPTGTFAIGYRAGTAESLAIAPGQQGYVSQTMVDIAFAAADTYYDIVAGNSTSITAIEVILYAVFTAAQATDAASITATSYDSVTFTFKAEVTPA